MIASLSKKVRKQNLEVYLVTPDKDIDQLVGDNIKKFHPKKNSIIDVKKIEQKYSLRPEQLIDYFALVGDSTDNIPGVKGIGHKGAIKLIKDFGSLENIYANIKNINNKRVATSLQKYQEDAFLSKKLFLVDSDVSIEFELDKCKVDNAVNKQLLISWFQKLGLNTFLADIADEPKNISFSFEEVTQKEELIELVKKIKQQEQIVIDINMTGHSSHIEGIALLYEADKIVYIPIYYNTKISKEEIFKIISPILIEGPAKVGYNLKKIYKAFLFYGILLFPIKFDTILAASLIDYKDHQSTLDDLCLKYLSSHAPQLNPNKEFFQRDLCLRVKLINELALKLDVLLKKHSQENYFLNLEIALIPILAETELSGILVDEKKLSGYFTKTKKLLTQLENEIYEQAGEQFNINKTKEVSRILFEKLKLPPSTKTKTGYSTSSKVLEKLITYHSLPQLILKYRQKKQLLSNSKNILANLINPKSKRLHCLFWQNGYAGTIYDNELFTLSSEIYNMFSASSDYLLLFVNYPQIETRILAHFSQDTRMLEIFNHGEEPYITIASNIFNVDKANVTDKQLQEAKILNFSIIDGESSKELAQKIGITEEQAQKLTKNYFSCYSGIKNFIERTFQKTKRDGFVTSILGRIHFIEKNNLHLCIRTLIQGSISDILKQSIVKIYNERNEKLLNFKFLFFIYNSLFFEVSTRNLEDIKKIICTKMKNIAELSVPLKLSIDIGKTCSINKLDRDFIKRFNTQI